MDNITVYGVGTWSGWYVADELENAKKYGYTYSILEGYIFDSKDLFSSYINEMNKMKESADRNSPQYLIAKLLNNSLFGRFGMKPFMSFHIIVDKSKVNSTVNKLGFNNVINVTEIGNKSIISYKSMFSRTPLINMPIAATITTKARIHMTKFKNNPDILLYYTDTDSIYTNKILSEDMVHDTKIGFMKKEKTLTKFVAIGPKVYGGIDINGNEFTKVKGYKNPISVSQLELLLQENIDNNNSVTLTHDKWKKDLIKGIITIDKDSIYQLRPTNNKRNLVYKDGILIGTSNKIINDV